MNVAEIIRAMKAAGCTDTQILDAIQTMDEDRRAKGRARVAKHRMTKENGNVTDVSDVTSVTSTSATTKNTRARGEDKSSTPQKKDTSSLRSDVGTSPKKSPEQIALETVLDAEHAAAVVDHRKKLRKALNEHGAKGLARKFARCADPNAAADEMITAGWQGFEPEWLEGRNMPRGRSPPQSGGGSQPPDPMMQALQRRYERNDDSESGQGEIEAAGGTVRRLPATGTGGY